MRGGVEEGTGSTLNPWSSLNRRLPPIRLSTRRYDANAVDNLLN
ncbi:hypothetical protein LINPERPRIM_LOCUS4265 [Linum perenne]